MRHRKKLISAVILLAIAYATICFWPHSNPDAVRALAALREIVQLDEATEAPPAMGGEPQNDVQICLEIDVVAVNMTDATAGLFAQPGRVDDTRIVRRTKNATPFLKMLRDIGVAQLIGSPRLTTVSGQTASLSSGGEVAVPAPTTAGTMKPPSPAPQPRMAVPAPTPAGTMVTYRKVGTTVSMTARVTAEGGIILDFEFEQAQLGKIRSVATDQGQMAIPEIHKVSAHARAELKPGETLIVGGLAQKRPEKSVFKLPVLGELPGVGSCFQFTREREIEEELILLVTPRILSAEAAPPEPVASAPGR
jgi:Flp pilus assembly secretin CpaC